MNATSRPCTHTEAQSNCHECCHVVIKKQRLLVGDTITAISDNPHAMRLRYSRATRSERVRFATQGQVSEKRDWFPHPADVVRVAGPGA